VAAELMAHELDLGGRLSARRATFITRADIGGSVQTKEGLKAQDLRLRRKARAEGPLVGGTIRLGEKARAEDLFGTIVELGERATARRIFANTVRLSDGAAADEVTYTGSVDLRPGAQVRTPPRRADALPPFPL